MLLKLFLLFTLFPLIELYILIKIGTVFGILPTILLIVGTGITGAFLVKQQGLMVLQRIQNEVRNGKFPADELIEGFILLIAGVVLVTPGLITDMLGFVGLFPVTRQHIINWVKNKISQMVQNGQFRITGFF